MDLNSDQLAALTILADGIIPADESDAGAASVRAGPRLAERIRSGVSADLYRRGLDFARSLANERYRREVSALTPSEVHDLLGLLRDQLPGFFKQLRMDVSALYLSDPGVWKRIGFPGPSAQTGGHRDFDQQQK